MFDERIALGLPYHLHLHDLRKEDWRDHRAVPSGVIDFEGLFSALGQAGFTGFFDVELEEPEREAALSRTGRHLTRLCGKYL